MYYFTVINQISRVWYSFQKNTQPVIVTLDPKKLAEKKQQCLHIGGLQTFTTHILLLGQSTPVLTTALQYDGRRYGLSDCYPHVFPPYPPDTKAFLHYSMSPERPRIAGELRLRVTSSDDPASFESGSDLLRTDGLPWSRPLYVLPTYFFPLYRKLREERFVPDDLDRVLLTLPPARLNYCRSHILYTLNDTFIVDFSDKVIQLFVITERGVESLFNRILFSDQRQRFIYLPYTGAYTNHHLSILLH
jgi:hypothetical protein